MHIHRVIANAPFLPFNILFTRVIQLFDTADLERLERFAASLRTEIKSSHLSSYPCQIYELLCRAARLYITRDIVVEGPDSVLNSGNSAAPQDFDFVHFDSDTTHEDMGSEIPGFERHMPSMLSDWYRENQQVMSLLDGDVMF